MTPHSIVHSDCVVGSPGSLSDTKLKANVTELESSHCLSLCNALAPSAYNRVDTNEVRCGMIAQDVKAALADHSFPDDGIIGSKLASVDPGSFENPGTAPEELMTLAYDRLVPFLLGAVQRLTERVQQLEG